MNEVVRGIPFRLTDIGVETRRLTLADALVTGATGGLRGAPSLDGGLLLQVVEGLLR